jgi:hypothetical protein
MVKKKRKTNKYILKISLIITAVLVIFWIVSQLFQGLDNRASANKKTVIITSWEFKSDNTEGWSAENSNKFYLKKGRLVIEARNNKVRLVNQDLNVPLPQGVKSVQIRLPDLVKNPFNLHYNFLTDTGQTRQGKVNFVPDPNKKDIFTATIINNESGMLNLLELNSQIQINSVSIDWIRIIVYEEKKPNHKPDALPTPTTTNGTPVQNPSIGNLIPIAVRTPNQQVADALKPYWNGTKGNIKFILYAGIDALETLDISDAISAGQVELGALISCGPNSVEKVESEISRYKSLQVTYLINDCEKGGDAWSIPDVVDMADKLSPLINNSNNDFRWLAGMQYGYLENKNDGQGRDASVCTLKKDRSSCDFAASFAGQVWNRYNANDVFAIFGESGAQKNPSDFRANNESWISYVQTAYPQNEWWGINGLVDKNNDGNVDVDPAMMTSIVNEAKIMGADAFGIIWLGKTASELSEKDTQLLQFLDLYAQGI